jgi:hypothetical protein
MVARITFKGYAAKELLLSDGPVNWIGLNGRNHGEYWLFKTAHFHVNLDLIPEVFTGTISARVARNTAVDFMPQLLLQELVAQPQARSCVPEGLAEIRHGVSYHRHHERKPCGRRRDIARTFTWRRPVLVAALDCDL